MTKEQIGYEKQGTAIAFPSQLVHRSYYAEDNTIKLCLFFRHITPTINFYTKNRVTRNKRVRRQSEDILENLNWYLGEDFTTEDINILRRHHRNLTIRAVNYKEIMHDKAIIGQKDNIIDKEENDQEFEVE